MNLYTAQNGREFATTPEEIRAFLGINYIISISKLPNCYCSVDSYLSNDIVRIFFVNIIQNFHFNDNETSEKSDNVYKMRNVINHLNEAFQKVIFDAKRQSIDENLTKCKVRMLCKQYIKNKPIKWGFTW